MNRPPTRPIRAITIASVAVALSAGITAVTLGQSPSAPSASLAPPSLAPGSLTIEGAWARVSPMIDRAGVAYMVIHNGSAADDALVAVTTPAAGTVELHETTATASGEMAMQQVASIPVAAGGMTELKPGGYHMMLIDLAAPLTDGTTIELTLTFQGGTVLTVPAEVRSSAPMGSAMPIGSAMPMGSAVPLGSAAP